MTTTDPEKVRSATVTSYIDTTPEAHRDGENRQEKMGMWAAWKQWPKSIFCIVGNEFCERFNFYGMRAVLFLYLLKLGFDDDGATTMYHLFSVLCYFSPILGAILADGYLGKFHVILWLSLLYASGSIILAVSSMLLQERFHPLVILALPQWNFSYTIVFGFMPLRFEALTSWLDLVGLFVIGVGTGGIKPCVAPFGADQFVKGQEALIEPYFSFFYAAINCGSLLSIILSPMMQVQRCMGQDTCYPLAFGIPAILMIMAVLLFLFGSLFGYRKLPPKENIFAEVFKAIWTAIKNKRSFEIKREHWLDHYMDNHSCKYDDRCSPKVCHKLQFIDDVKQLFRVLIMYLPIPFFWTLFDQQGSRWMIQTVEMNYDLGGWTMPPSLVQAINPILILVFIPLFQGIIYPLVRKCGINPTPLRRMVVGGVLAALAFVVAGAVQIFVDRTLPVYPADNTGQVNFFNVLPCNVTVTNGADTYTVATNGTVAGLDTNYLIDQSPGTFVWTVTGQGCPADVNVPANVTVDVAKNTISFAVIADASIKPSKTGYDTSYVGTLEKDQQGLGLFTYTIYDYRSTVLGPDDGEMMLILCSVGRKETTDFPCNPHDSYNFDYVYFDNYNVAGNDMSSYEWPNKNTYRSGIFESNRRNGSTGTLLPGVWYIYQYNGSDWQPNFNDDKWTSEYMKENSIPLNINFTVWGQGAVWAFTLYEDEMQTPQLNSYQVVGGNTLSVLWQVPQFAIITAAEICMSITGIEFSYSQCAQSMKSLVQAAWLLTISIGDTIIIIIADSSFLPTLADELFFFAGLMVLVTLIFMLMAIFYYEYRFYDQVDEEEIAELLAPSDETSTADDVDKPKDEEKPKL